MPGLLAPNLKVSRAKIHLDTLDAAVDDFRSKPEENQRVTCYDDLETKEFVIKCEPVNEDRLPTLGLIAGDFICNLRSSLDYVTWQLASPKFASHDTSFPIVGKNSLDAQIKITRCTYGIPDDAVTIMKSLQPYHAGDAYQSTHLWRLNKLWNLDKHRNVAIHSSISDEMLWLPRAVEPHVKTESLDDCAVVRFPLIYKDQMKFNPRPGVNVRFGSDMDRILLSIEDFREIYEFVKNEVIPQFARFFSKPDIKG